MGHELCTGQHLGPVGGRIVGEVTTGLIRLDPDSYCRLRVGGPRCATITGDVTGDFRMIDFLAFAKVDPTSRGQ